jgi:hypothetical protein
MTAWASQPRRPAWLRARLGCALQHAAKPTVATKSRCRTVKYRSAEADIPRSESSIMAVWHRCTLRSTCVREGQMVRHHGRASVLRESASILLDSGYESGSHSSFACCEVKGSGCARFIVLCSGRKP